MDSGVDSVKPSLNAKRTLGQAVAGGGALAAAVAVGEGVDGYLWPFVIIHAALIVGAVWVLVCAWKEIARAESLRFAVATYILADAVVVVGLYGVALSGSRVAVVLIIAIYCLWLGASREACSPIRLAPMSVVASRESKGQSTSTLRRKVADARNEFRPR